MIGPCSSCLRELGLSIGDVFECARAGVPKGAEVGDRIEGVGAGVPACPQV
jgi:hypothetical protein